MRPTFSHWGAIRETGGAGAFLFCLGEGRGKPDFHARFFAPDHNIPEDPATGSAVATLPGPLLVALSLGDGAHSWVIAQGEDMGKPSLLKLFVEVKGGRLMQVRVGGQAVPVSEGTITV